NRVVFPTYAVRKSRCASGTQRHGRAACDGDFLNRRIPKRIEPEPLAVRREKRCSHVSFSASNRRLRQLCELSHIKVPVRDVRDHLSVGRDRFELTSKPREVLIVRKHDRKSCNGTGRYKLQLPSGIRGKSSNDGRSQYQGSDNLRKGQLR